MKSCRGPLRPMRDAAWQSRAKNSGSVPDGGLRGRDSTPLGLCGLHSPGRGTETHHRRSLWAFSGIMVPGQSGHSVWHGGPGAIPQGWVPYPLHSSEPSDATANCLWAKRPSPRDWTANSGGQPKLSAALLCSWTCAATVATGQ